MSRSAPEGPLYLSAREFFSDQDETESTWDLGDWDYLRNSYETHIGRDGSLRRAQVFLIDDQTQEEVLVREWNRK